MADSPKSSSSNTVLSGPNGSGGYQFGAFKGVFTPSILTILGVVMYLRIGWVLGNLGLPLTLLTVTMASAITFVTALSLSALASNMKVEGGGAYFMISRSLGVEIGAAIGLPLFLAQSLGAAFYITGFAEALIDVFPSLEIQTIGFVTLFVLTGLALVSADLALKTQFFVMAAIVISLISFFWGGLSEATVGFNEAVAAGTESVKDTRSFWFVFAVFFPAVTGIEAGLSMSGDLKKPSQSLPRGTLSAVVTGYLVYMLIPLILAYSVRTGAGALDQARLLDDLLIIGRIARWPQVVILGVWAAALSSAMGAILGAPRTLQALARDKVVPGFLGRGYGRGNDPRIAMVISTLIALAGVTAGDLNLIAPLLTMFFLTSYGLLNISAGLEGLVAPPSWRPAFKVAWPICIAGSLACFGAMFMIKPGATIAALTIAFGVYWAMKRRNLKARWGDMRRGLLMQIAQYAVYKLARAGMDERNWKPNILVLSGNPASRWYLIELGTAISSGRGFLTVAAIVPNSTSPERRLTQENNIANFLEKKRVSALAKVYRAESPLKGALRLVDGYGFGPLAPNTLLFGETEKEANFLDFAKLIKMAVARKLNVVIVRESEKQAPMDKGMRIDIWWGGERNNIGFMLALAQLLIINEGWKEAEFNLKRIVENEEAVKEAEKNLGEFIDRVRLQARPDVLVRNRENIFDQIRESSNGTDLVFLGIRPPEPEEKAEDYKNYYQHLLEATAELPPTALCLALEDINFNAIFTETS